MAFDAQTEVYVPILYILMMNKTEDFYWHAFHFLIFTLGCKLSLSSITCDFEKGLMNALKDQFLEAELNGCFLHFKQVMHIKMASIKIELDQIKTAMSEDCIDILTIIPHD